MRVCKGAARLRPAVGYDRYAGVLQRCDSIVLPAKRPRAVPDPVNNGILCRVKRRTDVRGRTLLTTSLGVQLSGSRVATRSASRTAVRSGL